MKKLQLIIVILFSVVAFAQEENHKPLENLVTFNVSCLKSENSAAPCIKVVEDDIKYTLIFDEEGMLKTLDINQPLNIYMKLTSSKNFKAPEGYTIENTFGDVKKYGELKRDLINWGYYIKLPSGWNATFFTPTPKEADKINFFFKKYK